MMSVIRFYKGIPIAVVTGDGKVRTVRERPEDREFFDAEGFVGVKPPWDPEVPTIDVRPCAATYAHMPHSYRENGVDFRCPAEVPADEGTLKQQLGDLRAENEEFKRHLDDLEKFVSDNTALRAKLAAVEGLVADLAHHGVRFDLNPTVDGRRGAAAYLDYMQRIDQSIRDRAAAALGPQQRAVVPTLTREELIEQLQRMPRGSSVSYTQEVFDLLTSPKEENPDGA